WSGVLTTRRQHMTPSSVVDWIDEVTTSDTWAQVVARAWTDEAFEARLMSDPATVLHEAGVEVPVGLAVRVQAETEELDAAPGSLCLVLPPKPAAGELRCEHLGTISQRSGARICGPGFCTRPW